MKCFYHEERDAVATCQKCGKSLCKECSLKYKPIVCEECYQEEIQKQQKEFEEFRSRKRQEQEKTNKTVRVKMVIGIIIGIFEYFMGITFANFLGALFSAMLGFGLPFGVPVWFKFYDNNIASHLDGFVLILPIIYWLIIILLKFVIGIYIGYFIGPFVAIYTLYKYFKNNSIEE